MFGIGERIVHPLHGAGVVEQITTQMCGETERVYYVFRAFQDHIVVLIPENTCESLGVRPIMDEETAQKLLNSFSETEYTVCENWNRRYRDNMDRLRTGKPEEVACVVKTLTLRDWTRKLSTGERKMLLTAKRILYSELSLVTGRSAEELDEALNTRMRNSLQDKNNPENEGEKKLENCRTEKAGSCTAG